MANRVEIHHGGEAIYDIVLEDSFLALKEEVVKFSLDKHKICIVTDSNVASLYLDEVKEVLSATSGAVETFVFPAGEENKNLETVKNLYEFLIQHKFERKDMLVALGGGVVGDLCGYAAATYLRGVSFIQIPTTLLSQVDSSIGGKTGVDFDAYKNMVGAFHMPKLVYTNIATLLTLDSEQFSSGMGEIVKHGLIKDLAYYDWLQENKEEIQKRNLTSCEEMVLGSDKIKQAVVENDPYEQGERAILNFGHTLGHAIEKLMNFEMCHGQCVALGCLCAGYLSKKKGFITESELEKMKSMFDLFELPTTFPKLDFDLIISTTKSDKKMDAGTIKFVLLKEIGQAYVDLAVTDADMKEALAWIAGGHDEN